MNFSSIIGIVAAVSVFVISLLTATSSWGIFLDPHGILIVLGGTMAASLVCFPLKTFVSLFKVFFNKVIGKYAHAHENVIYEIVALSKGYRDNANYLQENVKTIKTHFLRDAIELMNAGGISPDALDTILRRRALTHFKKHDKEASIFKIIAKFPPAFGLMGTTLGMIALLQGLGSPDAFKKLGPAMAIGLVATLYGIALSNLIFIPIGENLTKLNEEDETVREMVIDGIELLRKKEHPLIVEEYLKSYLLPTDRAKLKKVA